MTEPACKNTRFSAAEVASLHEDFHELSRLCTSFAAVLPPEAPVRDLAALATLIAQHVESGLPLDLAIRLLRVLQRIIAFLIPLKLGLVVDSTWPEDGEASDA